MRRLVIAALLVFSFATPVVAHADPCRARCRDKARACKDRCKLGHAHFDDDRHRCMQTCDLHEHECRSGC